jgi:hypothetical protein
VLSFATRGGAGAWVAVAALQAAVTSTAASSALRIAAGVLQIG